MPWFGDNAAALDRFLDSPHQADQPVALFDWDNTVIKNDIGAAVVAHLITEGLVLRPPDWSVIPYLTPGARARLAQACAGDGPRLPSRTDIPCATELISLYRRRTLHDGTPAFAGYDHRTYKPSAAWQSHLLAGHTPEQVRRITREVIARSCRAPVDQKQKVGLVEVEGYIRIYRPMQKLIQRMRRRGFAIWVISASPQHVVETFAARVGIPRQRVVGIRSLQDEQGRLSYGFEGCGAVKDRDNTMITYLEGKRCWIRKVVGREAVFGAGDSVTDVAFLRDVKGLRLVINRGYPELMCYAYHGRGHGGWIINPMFIEPRPRQSAPYPCSTNACVDSAGRRIPCRLGGRVLSDQVEAVAPK